MAKLILKDRGVQTFQDIRLLSMVNQLPRFVSNIEVIMNGLENKAKIDKLEPIKLPGILDKEKEIMGNAFQDFLLNQHDVHFLIRMTKKYHKSLLGFSNRAFVNEKNNEKQSPAIKQLYLKICSIIEELLQSVVSESKNYLNEKLVASRYYAVLHGESLQLKFIMLEKKMAECHVDQYMSSLLKEFFLDSGV